MKIHLFFFILLFWVTILPARSELEPKYRFERCQEVKGICKAFCDDIEYDYGYCIKWRIRYCI
ncbi:beta-defensin 110-like isoform X2 [Mesoplodon densirostris]|uniref:beta-defensin 110-like isoform X2 n=1 Tax=Mesoplodon densirostris TaxID=48708 RepID=UPI0028DC54B4|nr:beta-defensin 110-like isoform X2 [Mesoplodon densirostris]